MPGVVGSCTIYFYNGIYTDEVYNCLFPLESAGSNNIFMAHIAPGHKVGPHFFIVLRLSVNAAIELEGIQGWWEKPFWTFFPFLPGKNWEKW